MAGFSFKPTFGATTTTASGGLFGGTMTSSAPGLAFGASSATPAFGTTTTTSAPLGFGGLAFGASSATPAFGTTTTTSAPLGFGGIGTPAFGTTPASGTTGFGTGTTGFGLTGTGTGFGTTGATGFGTTGFGATSFGVKPTTGLSFGTGTGTGTGVGLLGTQTVQPQAVQTPVASIVTAISAPQIFGDERDAVIAKWNQLQAFWGTGRGYYNQQGHYADFAPDNPYSFFKAVGYNVLPETRNEDGLVALTIGKKMSDVCDNQQAVVDALQKIIIGSQPNASLCVEGTRPLVDDKTEMVIFVQQRANTGITSRIPASDLFNHLGTIKQQLMSAQLSISGAVPRTGMTPEQKKLYIDNPPAGIDPRIWEQAKLDNPDPSRMIPVPMVGFSELHNRLKHQEQQTNLHQTRLDLTANTIAELQRNQTNMVAKIEEYKRNQLALGHRILKVLVKQELYRKHGYATQADEEHLHSRLQAIHAELSAPMQFKGRLNELMSQMRMQNQLGVVARSEASYQMDSGVQREIKQHLQRQQEGLSVLMQILRDDLRELKIVEEGLVESGKLRR